EAYEPESIARHNLNRYLYATSDFPANGTKIATAERLSGPRLRLSGHLQGIEVEATPFAAGELVVSGADNDIARHATARRARGWLLSLASELDIAEFSVHAAGASRCLACIHPGDAARNLSQPTHPLVAAWPALIAASYLSRPPASWRHGRLIRVL